MFVELAVIRESRTPHRVEVAFPPDRIQLDPRESSLRVTEPVKGFCELALLAEDCVRVRGEVKTELTVTCSRCLSSFSRSVEKHFDLVYVPDPPVEGGDDINLKYDDLEVGFYRDDRIDLSSVMLEPILIDLPMKMVCDPDCKGLCDQCGINLNTSSCTCEPTTDTRWQALAEFKKRFTES